MNHENNHQYEHIKNIYRNIPKFIPKYTAFFYFSKFSVTDSRKNGLYFGTKKWGPKKIKFKSNQIRFFEKNQISNQIKFHFSIKIKFQIKSNSIFWKKSNFKSNQIQKFEFFSNSALSLSFQERLSWWVTRQLNGSDWFTLNNGISSNNAFYSRKTPKTRRIIEIIKATKYTSNRNNKF